MGVKMLKMAIFFKLIMEIKQKTYIQEVPAFRDFWYQNGITKFGDHEF